MKLIWLFENINFSKKIRPLTVRIITGLANDRSSWLGSPSHTLFWCANMLLVFYFGVWHSPYILDYRVLLFSLYLISGCGILLIFDNSVCGIHLMFDYRVGRTPPALPGQRTRELRQVLIIDIPCSSWLVWQTLPSMMATSSFFPLSPSLFNVEHIEDGPSLSKFTI